MNTRRKTLFFAIFSVAFFSYNHSYSQTKLYLDSMLKESYLKKYPFSENLTCIPYFCDPNFHHLISKKDTHLCGKFVFVNKQFEVKVPPIFQLPCHFEPKFGEGWCAVNINNELVFIDSTGKTQLNTKLLACSPNKNKILPFKNGKAKVYKGSGGVRNYFDVYYIDKRGQRIPEIIYVNIKPKNKKIETLIASNTKKDSSKPIFDLPLVITKNKYPISELEAEKYKRKTKHQNNRMLLYYECNENMLEKIAAEDTVYCNKFVFVDTFFNVKISQGFQLPCSFEPEFSEGLCAVSIDSQIVYIDTIGKVVIKTGLASCSKEHNKATTFKNGIATLYKGNSSNNGDYQITAINTFGERVRLLEFDNLELADKIIDKFSNLTIEETTNCFVGKGKTNGLWFLVEKSGKVKKKLELK